MLCRSLGAAQPLPDGGRCDGIEAKFGAVALLDITPSRPATVRVLRRRRACAPHCTLHGCKSLSPCGIEMLDGERSLLLPLTAWRRPHLLAVLRRHHRTSASNSEPMYVHFVMRACSCCCRVWKLCSHGAASQVYGPLRAAEGGILEQARLDAADKELKSKRKEVNLWKKKNERDLDKDVRMPTSLLLGAHVLPAIERCLISACIYGSRRRSCSSSATRETRC